MSGGGGLYTLDSASHVTGNGLRLAFGVDLRFLRVLHVDAALGHSFLLANEETHSDWSSPDDGPNSAVIDEGHQVGLFDLHLALRCDLGPRAWLTVGYRYDAWQGPGDDSAQFSAGGVTFAVGFRLGGR